MMEMLVGQRALNNVKEFILIFPHYLKEMNASCFKNEGERGK